MADMSLDELSVKLKTVEKDSRDTAKAMRDLQKDIAGGKFTNAEEFAVAVEQLAKYQGHLHNIKLELAGLRAEKQIKIDLFSIDPTNIDALKKKVKELSATITEQANKIKIAEKELGGMSQESGDVNTRAQHRANLQAEIDLYLKAWDARERFNKAAGFMTSEASVRIWQKRDRELALSNKHAKGSGIGPDKLREVNTINEAVTELQTLAVSIDGKIRGLQGRLASSANESVKSYLLNTIENEEIEQGKIFKKIQEYGQRKEEVYARPDARITTKTYEEDGGIERKLLELRALEEKISSTQAEKVKLLKGAYVGEPADELSARFKLNDKLAKKQSGWEKEQESLLKGNKPLQEAWNTYLKEQIASTDKLKNSTVELAQAEKERASGLVELSTPVAGRSEFEQDLSLNQDAERPKVPLAQNIKDNWFKEAGDPELVDKITASLVKEAEAYKAVSAGVTSLREVKKTAEEGGWKVTGEFMSDSGGGPETLTKFTKHYDALGNEVDAAAKSVRALTEAQQKLLSQKFPQANAIAQGEDPRFKLVKATYNTAGVGSGVTQLDYGFRDQEGMLNKMSLSVDRYGKALINTTRSTRSFAQGVARDTVEMLKWSIAMSIIYVPMRKLAELMQVMIRNEALLADVAVTVSNAHISVGEIFDTVAKAADAAGESVSGVIESFTTAYRATGNLGTAEERMVVATTLMNDGLILAKISTLDQAEAIDTLAASLRQSGMSLDQGGILLDKWVKTTKIANVDLTTLATGFAVLGDSADAAGLSMDELNGLMATIAETGIAGGRESAAQARAIVSGFQSDKAAKELMRYGIAVNDVTTNELRPFMDVMQQIYDLRQAGVLSDADIGKITLALGGGTRRQAIYSAFLESFNRVKEVAAESATAQGDAAGAMEKELDTVQTAITRLGNSFQSLAETLGESGGLLDLFKNLANLGAGIVGVFDDITNAIGKAAPVLYTLGIATLLFQAQVPGRQNAISSSIARAVAWMPNKLTGETYGGTMLPGYEESKLYPGQYRNRGLDANTGGTTWVGAETAMKPDTGMKTSNWLMGSNAGGYALGALATIPALASTLTSEDDNKWEQAGLGLAGAAIGALVTGGNPIGAIIGQSAGTAFANVASDILKTNIEEYRYPETSDKYKEPEAVFDENLEEARQNLYGGMKYNERNLIVSNDIFGAVLTQVLKLSEDTMGKKVEPITGEQIAYMFASEENRIAFDAAKAVKEAADGTTSIPGTFENRQAQLKIDDARILADLQAQQKTTYVEQLTTGELTPVKYTNAVQALDTFATQASGFYAALGPKLQEDQEKFRNAADVYAAYLSLRVYGSEEQINTITGYVSQIQHLEGLMDAALKIQEGEDGVTEALFGEVDAMGLTDPFEGTRDEVVAYIQKKIDEVFGSAAPVTTATLDDIRYKELISNLPSTGPSVNTEADAKLIYQRALELDAQRLASAKEPIIGEDLDKARSLMEDFFFVIGDSTVEGGEVIFKAMSEFGERISSEGFAMAKAELEAKGIIEKKDTSVLGFQTYDVTKAQYNQAMQGYAPLLKTLEKLGYEENNTELIGIFKDGIYKEERDQGIANYLLQQLVDLNQDQLDGMYNIPDGANFWIPYNEELIRMLQAGFAPDAAGFSDDGIITADNQNTDRIVNAINNAFGVPETPKRPFNWGTRNLDEGITGRAVSGISTTGRPDRFGEKNRGDKIGGKEVPEQEMSLFEMLMSRQRDDEPQMSLYEMLKSKTPTLDRSNRTSAESITERANTMIAEIIRAVQRLAANTINEAKQPRDYITPKWEKNPLLQPPTLPDVQGRYKSYQQLGSTFGEGKIDTAPQSKIDLKMDTKIQLVVDGRTLANVVKSYIMNDLLRAQAGSGSKTRNNVIVIS